MKKPKIVASIEARMTSSRLPGKVLMHAINDMSMLEFMIERVKQSKLIDEIIVATTINDADNPIINLCKKNGTKYYRGSENDVLLRVLEAHQSVNTDIIVELTGDCPLIDPFIIDEVIAEYLSNQVDFVSNAHIRSYPDGMDVTVFTTKLLEEVEKKATSQYDRENVTTYIYRGNNYRLKACIAKEDLFWPELRITLDDKGDYLLIKKIIKDLFPKKGLLFTAHDIVYYLKSNPELLLLNKEARVNIVPEQKVYNEKS